MDSGESCKRLCAAFRCGNDKEKVSVFSSEHGKNRECENAEELLGLEGEAASVYFSVFDDLILQQKD